MCLDVSGLTWRRVRDCLTGRRFRFSCGTRIVLETTRIRRQGFSHRIPFSEFLKRYTIYLFFRTIYTVTWINGQTVRKELSPPLDKLIFTFTWWCSKGLCKMCIRSCAISRVTFFTYVWIYWYNFYCCWECFNSENPRLGVGPGMDRPPCWVAMGIG